MIQSPPKIAAAASNPLGLEVDSFFFTSGQKIREL